MTYASFCEALGRGIIQGLIMTPLTLGFVYLLKQIFG